MNDLYYYSLAATTSKSTQAALKNISKINAEGKLPVVDIKSKGGPDIHKAVKEHNKKVEHKSSPKPAKEHKQEHKPAKHESTLKKISKVTASGKLPVVDIKSKGGPDIHKAVREHNKAVTHKDNAVKHAKNADTHSKMVEHHVTQANNPDNPPHIQAAHQTAAQANADAGHKQAAAAEANIRAENKKEAADRAKTPFYQMLAKQEFKNHSKAAVNASHQAIAATNTAKNISDTVNSQTPAAAAIVQPQTVYPAVLLSKGSNSLHPTAVKHPSHLLANHHLKRNTGGGEQWTVPLSTVTPVTEDITWSGDSHGHHPHGRGIARESTFITPGADPSLDQVNHAHYPHGLGIDTESSSLPIASDIAYKKTHPTTDDVNDTDTTGYSLPPVNNQDPTKLISSSPPTKTITTDDTHVHHPHGKGFGSNPLVTTTTVKPAQHTVTPVQTQFLKDALDTGNTLSKPVNKTSTSPIFSKINLSGINQNKTNQNDSIQIHNRHPPTHHHFHHQIGVPNMIPDNTSRPDVVWNQEIAKFNAQPKNVKKMKIATEYNTNLHDAINTAHGLSLQEGHHYTQAELDKRKTKQEATGMIKGPLNFTKPTQAQIDIGMHQINTVPPPPPGGYLRINPDSIAGKLQRGYVPYEHDPDTQQLTDQGMADALGVAGRPSNIFPGKRNTVTPDPDPSDQSTINDTSVPNDTAEQLAILGNSTDNLSNFAQEIPGLEILVTGAAFLFLAYMIVENI